METKTSFGAWLRHRRRQLDLTQVELAARVNYSVVTIRKLERDELRPSKQLAERLAQCLDIAPEQQVGLLVFARSAAKAALPLDSLPGHNRAQSNLPLQLTPFFGRTAELLELGQILADPLCRLLTVAGPGGIGKTRLALELVQAQVSQIPHGVHFVSLAPLHAAEHIVPAIAEALDFRFQADNRPPKQQLLDYLRHKQLLLVLDNFEHLRDGVGLIQELLQHCPTLRLLVTTRERLQLSSETVFTLHSMDTPNGTTIAETLTYSTVQLFIATARRTYPQFVLNTANAQDVERICRLVGGMPLGIILAAAWVAVLSPAEIAAELAQGFDFLAADLHDLPARHHSMRAVLAHSWQRLTQAEQVVFMRLALFRGGFTRQAAQSIAGATLEMLSALVNKSLVQRDAGNRYTIHELLRQYAEAELEAAGQHTRIGNAHCIYYTNFLAHCEQHLKGPEQIARLAEIERDSENVRTAWMWAVAHKNRPQLAQALESLGSFYATHSRFQEGEQLFRAATESFSPAEAATEPHLLVRLLIWQTKFSRILDHPAQTKQHLHRALRLLNQHTPDDTDSRSLRAAVLHGLGQLAMAQQQPDAHAWFEQSLAVYSDLGNLWGKANVLLDLQSIGRNRLDQGVPHQHQQQSEVSKQMVLQSLAIFRTIGDQVHIAFALERLGVVYLTLGQAEAAQTAFEECLDVCQTLPVLSRHAIEATAYLGVVKEYLGLYTQMYTQGQTVLTLAQDIGDVAIMHLGYCLSGGAALVQQQYIEALAWMRQDVALNRKRGYGLVFSLANLGLTNYALGNIEQAQQQLIEALTGALKTRTVRGSVHAVLLGAILLAARNKHVKAVEVYALANCFPFVANSRWCADVAGPPLGAVMDTLSPTAIAAAQKQGQARNLWKTAEMLLAEFENDK
jgi:predicted ATPase/transcriptional regulator with XRE-family HTH domain